MSFLFIVHCISHILFKRSFRKLALHSLPGDLFPKMLRGKGWDQIKNIFFVKLGSLIINFVCKQIWRSKVPGSFPFDTHLLNTFSFQRIVSLSSTYYTRQTLKKYWYKNDLRRRRVSDRTVVPTEVTVSWERDQDWWSAHYKDF